MQRPIVRCASTQFICSCGEQPNDRGRWDEGRDGVEAGGIVGDEELGFVGYQGDWD